MVHFELCHFYLKEEERPVKVFQSRVDTAPVVVVEQEVDGVELAVFFADDVDVGVEEGKSRTEALADQAELGEVTVHRSQGGGRLLQLLDGSRHDGDSPDGGLASSGHQLVSEDVAEVRQTVGAEPDITPTLSILTGLCSHST